MTALLASLLLINTACESPLFNHANAEDPSGRFAQREASAPLECTVEFPVSGLCADLKFKSGPSTEEESPFTLTFFMKDTGAPVDPAAEVFVKLWMPAMGHGSSRITTTHGGTGVYENTRVFFIMPGVWEIRVELRDGTHAVMDRAAYTLSL